ncbi:hypothetical protein vseg_015961 [Gypsophila vaccaria]
MFTFHSLPKNLHHHHHRHRTFIAARVKWARDPYLDTVVSREKNLLQCLTLKHQLISCSPPSATTSPLFLFRKHPSLFSLHPSPHITPPFLSLHLEELSLHSSQPHRRTAALRLCKFLMLTNALHLPLSIIDLFKFDLGLPFNYLLEFLPLFPDLFRVCLIQYNGASHVGLELVKWPGQLAPRPAVDKLLKFSMSFPPGFDLQKRVLEYIEEWQRLPYVSPYEDAFHLAPRSDQAEKWAVSVLHEMLSVLISKKTEVRNVVTLGEYLGFGDRFKKALVRYPGMFYLSNKNRTQTVVLREAFRKDVLIERHPLMGMRHRYIYLMSKSGKGRKSVRKLSRVNVNRVEVVNKGVRNVVKGNGEMRSKMDNVEC